MKEQKKYHKAKVYHSTIVSFHACCVVDYYPTTGEMAQLNFTNELYARKNTVAWSIGMWRIKQQKLNHLN